MAFNPLANFIQGQKAGQAMQDRRTEADEKRLRGLAAQLGEQSEAYKELMVKNPEAAMTLKQTFSTDNGGVAALIDDSMSILYHLESDPSGASAREVIVSGIKNVPKFGGRNTKHRENLLNILETQGVDALKANLNNIHTVMSGVKGGDKTNTVQSSKILEDGTIIQVRKGGGRQVISSSGEILEGDAARDAIKASSKQSFERKKELARLTQTIKREQAKENLLTTQQTDIQRGNIQRLGALSSTATGRNSAIKKATKFKLALENGEVSSGAGRKAASFVPGVFTSQGQFDEEFNAFAEVAARQQLKASGETRPTDADVQGMKQAMFGLGRDESVNVQLLADFIKDNQSQTQELDQLIEASKSGNLSSFTFTNSSGDGGQRLEDMTIEQLEALRSRGGQ